MFGYDVVDKKNVINPVEGAIVKEIFSLYAQDYTAAYIADEMRKRGIRTKKGKYLTEKAIYKMLQNTKYNGKIKHGDTVYDNIYPKIVDDVLWQSVQHIRDGNKHAPGRKKEIFDFILSGKLVCGDCKRLMVGVSGTSKTGAKHYYYTCLTHSRDKKPCGLKTACKKEIEDIVINTTWQLLSDNDSVKALAELICRRINEKSRNNANIKSLETKRTAALKASRNLIAAIEQGIITATIKPYDGVLTAGKVTRAAVGTGNGLFEVAVSINNPYDEAKFQAATQLDGEKPADPSKYRAFALGIKDNTVKTMSMPASSRTVPHFRLW